MNTYITGATTAVITPFKNGTLDEATYASLIQRQIDHNIDAICPVGTTGESATLTLSEHKRHFDCRSNGFVVLVKTFLTWFVVVRAY